MKGITLEALRTQNFGRNEPAIYKALRRISILFSYVCVRLRIHPNVITVVSTLLAVVAAILLVLPGSHQACYASLFILLSFILDCVDGEVARAAKQTSVTGTQLEHITSWLIIGFLQAGVSIGVLSRDRSTLILVDAFSSLVGWYGFYFLFLQLRFWIPPDADFRLLRTFSRFVYIIMPLDQNLLIVFGLFNAPRLYLEISGVLSPLLFLSSLSLFFYYSHTEPPAELAEHVNS